MIFFHLCVLEGRGRGQSSGGGGEAASGEGETLSEGGAGETGEKKGMERHLFFQQLLLFTVTHNLESVPNYTHFLN